MIKKDKIMNINVFNGDDSIKYIRYRDFEKMVDGIKYVHDDIEKEKDNKIKRLNNIINELEKQLLEWHSYWEDEDTYNYEYKTAYDYLQELKKRS